MGAVVWIEMFLPNPSLAVVELAKLTDYCLDPAHEDGKHKARVFAQHWESSGTMLSGFETDCSKPLTNQRSSWPGSSLACFTC